ncbi:MAG: hypothetical protein LBD20_08925 [Spirochaetaceae bacterium]|jgi:hypothetical protein|nr:hypothetical protein [Spirochaetaceae bacterium]
MTTILSKRGGGGVTHKAVFSALCICAALLSCVTEGADWEDDHKLNPALVGTWTFTSDYGDDTYTISADEKITHPDEYGTPLENAAIVYIYNFNSDKTAGGLIIKLADDKFNAVWFKNLKAKESVLLGAAYDGQHEYGASDYISDVSVDTLAKAKERFSPSNAEKWGGGSKQGGSPQSWVAP